MPKASRANSKKAAPSTSKQAASLASSQPLFEIDTKGSSSVRKNLLADQQPAQARLRKGQSIHKPLRSDLILAQRSSQPALSSKVTPSAEAQAKKNKVKQGKVDRATKERLKRLTGRDGQGEGLWGIKNGDKGEALWKAVKEAGGYDAWKEKEQPGEEEDIAMRDFLQIHDQKNLPVPKVSSPANTDSEDCQGELRTHIQDRSFAGTLDSSLASTSRRNSLPFDPDSSSWNFLQSSPRISPSLTLFGTRPLHD